MTIDQATTVQRSAPASAPATAGILHRHYLLVTSGACALVFLAAFESLAVTTIMPLVSRELDGAGLYALAFAGPLATGVIGMVAAGNWSDRRGPVGPLYASVAMFVLGLLIAGTAGSMAVLVAGRLVQGLGGGAMTVALYVVVARVYPPVLHPKIFAAFSAAWVIPSLVGPFAAGIVAQAASWHWVFLGVVGLVVPALLMIVPALRGLHGRPAAAEASAKADGPEASAKAKRWSYGRLAWAALAALAVLGLNLSAQVPVAGGALAAAAVVIALVAVRPLVPRGTLLARRGLPSVILARGLVSAAFFGAEVYLPYLLVERYSYSPTFAGLTLTFGAIAWAGASAVQGRLGTKLTHRLAIVIGSAMVLGAVVLALVTTAPGLAGRRRDRRLDLRRRRHGADVSAPERHDAGHVHAGHGGLQQFRHVDFRFPRRRAGPGHHRDRVHGLNRNDDGGRGVGRLLRGSVRPHGRHRRRRCGCGAAGCGASNVLAQGADFCFVRIRLSLPFRDPGLLERRLPVEVPGRAQHQEPEGRHEQGQAGVVGLGQAPRA